MNRVSFRLLIARLETRARENFWREYTADMLFNITRGLFSGDTGLKSYSEIMRRFDVKNEQPQEPVDEIRSRILKFLGGESE